MRFVACLLVAFVCSGAFASEPGQPLDCSDWVFLEPGHSCEKVIDVTVTSTGIGGSDTQFDNQGRFFRLNPVMSLQIGACPRPDGLRAMYRTRLEWFDGQTWIAIAYVDDRCLPDGTMDVQRPAPREGLGSMSGAALTFDGKGGRMFISLWSDCISGDCSAYPPGSTNIWLASFGGFSTTFEVLQTYTPQTALGFRIPYMPEGMAGADHFDTYWGPLAHPLDFTQAHPLQCNYPASAPHVGDYLTLADTVPTPAPGQGVYYVTAATYQGATRYGRKTTAGHMSGRDPALLPTCTLP